MWPGAGVAGVGDDIGVLAVHLCGDYPLAARRRHFVGDVGGHLDAGAGPENVGVGPGIGNRWYRQGHAPAAAFAGTLATRIKLAPARDPEYKGLVERANGYLETSFLETDVRAMTELPPVIPPIGLSHRIRLARDYYVRVDAADYSIDPRVIGRFVDITASPIAVVARCEGQVVARHDRSWAKHAVVTDEMHVTIAAQLRHGFAADRYRRTAAAARRHIDGHPVALRALPDYDVLFGVEFDSTPTTVRTTS